MKTLFVSALMLTGLLAAAQEPAKTTQTTKETSTATTATTPATPVTTAQPATAGTATAQPQVSQPASVSDNKKVEATTKEEKTEVKKANPAKKSK